MDFKLTFFYDLRMFFSDFLRFLSFHMYQNTYNTIQQNQARFCSETPIALFVYTDKS